MLTPLALEVFRSLKAACVNLASTFYEDAVVCGKYARILP